MQQKTKMKCKKKNQITPQNHNNEKHRVQTEDK